VRSLLESDETTWGIVSLIIFSFFSSPSAGNGSSNDGILASAVESILAEIGTQKNDVATYVNPFQGFAPDTNPTANWETLTLVDAGETNQNIPFEPLLIPARGVDAILAFDNSAEYANAFFRSLSLPQSPFVAG
jgi:lysophospholipase